MAQCLSVCRVCYGCRFLAFWLEVCAAQRLKLDPVATERLQTWDTPDIWDTPKESIHDRGAYQHTIFLCEVTANTTIFMKKYVCFFIPDPYSCPSHHTHFLWIKKAPSGRLSELKASKHSPFRSESLQTPVSLPARRTSASLKLDTWSLKTRHSSVLSLGGCRGLISRHVCHGGDGTAHAQKDPPHALPLQLRMKVPRAPALAPAPPSPRKHFSGKDSAIILQTAKWKVEGFVFTRLRVVNDNTIRRNYGD